MRCSHLTLTQPERRSHLERFLKDPLTNETLSILDRYNVDYVFLDKEHLENKNLSKYSSRFKTVLQLGNSVILRYIK